MFDPSLHNWVLVSIPQPFDRDHRLTSDVADVRLAGTDGRSVYLDSAGATLRYPTAVFGTCDTKFIAQHPKQRHIRNYVNSVLNPIHRELDHVDASLCGGCRHSQSTYPEQVT
jgi:hypothetical protein